MVASGLSSEQRYPTSSNSMVQPFNPIGFMTYGKCKQGHDLRKVDCPLLNDYDYINSFSAAVTSYFQKNKDTRVLDLSTSQSECRVGAH